VLAELNQNGKKKAVTMLNTIYLKHTEYLTTGNTYVYTQGHRWGMGTSGATAVGNRGQGAGKLIF
jgi:hypothetical protein